MFAIQLAHAAGYKVVTTASPKNHELCRTLGADVVFDVSYLFAFGVSDQAYTHSQYRDPGAIDRIKEATGNSLRIGLDAVSGLDTQKFSVQTFGPAGGKLIAILEVQKEAQDLRSDVAVQCK